MGGQRDRGASLWEVHRSKPALLASLMFIGATAFFGSSNAGVVTWAEFAPAPLLGVQTTYALGGGSLVDVTLTTDARRAITASNFDSLGSTETGLDYVQLRSLNSGGPGGAPATAQTVLTFSNFRAGIGHIRAFLWVGGVNGRSAPIGLTSSVPGVIQTSAQVGSTFDLSATETFPIAWGAAVGHFTTSASVGTDSRAIVIDIGSVAQVGTITMTVPQHIDDGISFGIGEEADLATPTDRATGGRIKRSPRLSRFGVR